MAEPDFATFVVATEPVGAGGEFFEPLRRHLGATSLGVNRLELQPRQRLRVHVHERQEELYLVLSGTLTLIVEGAENEIPVGTLARVGPSTRRQVANRGEVPVVFLAFGAAGEHESRDALAWGSWDEDGPGRSPRDVPLPPDFDD
jgi:mannose-6-phosphate isomerase-like protein (cupin superfamily)